MCSGDERDVVHEREHEGSSDSHDSESITNVAILPSINFPQGLLTSTSFYVYLSLQSRNLTHQTMSAKKCGIN
jgi:hypothetical protein